jgi:hypothetical protein
VGMGMTKGQGKAGALVFVVDDDASCGRRSQACCNQLTYASRLHRGNVMRKMAARSLADLVRMADALGIRQATH